MGNNRSRVAPARTLRILDSETRARFKNQRESAQLRLRLQDIQTKHNEALSQMVLDQHEIKAKLREFRHESEQRKFFESFEKRKTEGKMSKTGKYLIRLLVLRVAVTCDDAVIIESLSSGWSVISEISLHLSGSRKHSVCSESASDVHEKSVETIKMESSTLLLHDLNFGSEWEKSRFILHQPRKPLPTAKPWSTFETRQLQFASKLDARHLSSKQTDASLEKDSLSLHQHSERMKSTIKIAVARAARDSHTAARRTVRAYWTECVCVCVCLCEIPVTRTFIASFFPGCLLLNTKNNQYLSSFRYICVLLVFAFKKTKREDEGINIIYKNAHSFNFMTEKQQQHRVLEKERERKEGEIPVSIIVKYTIWE